jgi:hypothetical protein
LKKEHTNKTEKNNKELAEVKAKFEKLKNEDKEKERKMKEKKNTNSNNLEDVIGNYDKKMKECTM